jgi:hypothetical protein
MQRKRTPLPVDFVVSASGSVEMQLGDSRVVLVQRIGNAIRIATARRVKRNVTSSLVISGTLLLPVQHLREICQKAMAAAQDGE